MSLSSDVISQFIKATNDKPKQSKESTVYGIVTNAGTATDTDANNKQVWVLIDGASEPTPVTTTTNVEPNERVTIQIKDHVAIITGNMASDGRSARTAEVSSINSNLGSINADFVTVNEKLVAAEGDIDTLKTDYVTVTQKLTAAEGDMEYLRTDNIEINRKLTAAEGEIDMLQADYVTIDQKVTARDADIDTIRADNVEINKKLTAVDADIENLESDVGDINTLMFGSATGDTIHTNFANSVIQQVGTAQIKSAMIESVAADKITAGDIITNNVRVKSEDGSLMIADETIQISDDTRVRVQIGKDADGDYSISIWDQNGALMFSQGGITEHAIKDKIIRNDMVSDTANISAYKLDIQSLFEAINGSTNTIKSSRIYIDPAAQTLDIVFNILSQRLDGYDTTLTSHGTQISAVQGNINSKIWQQDITTAKNELKTETDKLSTQYSELDQKIDGVSATVSSHTSQIATKADNSSLTTVSDKVTNLEANLNGFQSSVSETYATKSEVSNIEFGGRNLLLDSATVLLDVSDHGNDNVSVIENDHVKISPINNGNVYNARGGITTALVREKDKQYTLSFEILSPTETGFFWWPSEHYAQYSYIPPSDSWQKITFTYVQTGDDAVGSTTFGFNNLVAGKVYCYKNLKLERGNKATDWTPAPEDVQSEIDTIQIIASDAHSTASNAKNDIDNLTIGGRNLLKDSRSVVLVSGDSNSYPIISELLVENGREFYRYSRANPELNPTSFGFWNTFPMSKITENLTRTEITVSYLIRCSHEFTHTAIAALTTINGSIQKLIEPIRSPIGTEWSRAYVTLTIPHEYGSQDTMSLHVYPTWMVIPSGEAENFYIDICDWKIEKGNRATDWTPAPEDIYSAIDSVGSRVSTAETKITQNTEDIELRATKAELTSTLANYSTTAQMNSAIQLKADSITSSVSSNYVSNAKLDNLVIGGRNLILNSDVEYSNNGYLVAEYVPVTPLVPKETYTLSINLTPAEGVESIRPHVSGGNAGICLMPVTGTERQTIVSTFMFWQYASGGTPEDNERNAHILLYRAPNDGTVTGNTTIHWIKVEKGDKATDWTPAPEDMATAIDTEKAQTTANTAQEIAIQADTLVQQLADSISMLVTDGNGTSLMTQTEDGWTFSTADIQTLVNATSETLSDLTTELGDATSAVNVLQQAISDLGEIAEYVTIGTYEDEPCIELGEGDSDFKLVITNTRIMFMEGGNAPAYITNQSLHIQKAVVEEELQQGGFVWKTRSNGNLGLVWKGVNS